MRASRSGLRTLAAIAAVASGSVARASVPADLPALADGAGGSAAGLGPSGAGLRSDEWRAAGIALGALAADGVLQARWKPAGCRSCAVSDQAGAGAGAPVNALDESAQDALRWSDPRRAQQASSLLANVAIPVLAGADAVRSTSSWGNAGRDVLVVAEAASLSTLATGFAKDGFSRLRPGHPALAGQGAAAYESFWSGHTQLAFSIAVSQAMQDTMRGDPAAPWIWAVGLTLASGVGYLRIAGDAHWLTDVLAGAAVGGAFGAGVPLLEKRLVHGVSIAPAPGGVALRF